MGKPCRGHTLFIRFSLGPDPFPTMVRDFQSVIGNEIKRQINQKEGRLPEAIVACVGGGSNAIGPSIHLLMMT